MSYNRLRLDWTLQTREERTLFAQEYLQFLKFPTSNELDQIASYILWGNKSQIRSEGIEIQSAHKTWDANPIESLDELIESPTFSENSILPPEIPPYKVPRFKFSRDEARAQSSKPILNLLETLWTRIDSLELELSYYELHHNRRKIPPRPSLLSHCPDPEKIKLKGESLTPSAYLSLKRFLVELRREQYVYRDTYKTLIQRHSSNLPQLKSLPQIQDLNSSPIPIEFTPYLCPSGRFPAPSDLPKSAKLQKRISHALYSTPYEFNFLDPTHVRLLNDGYTQFQDSYSPLIPLLDYYISLTPLKPAYYDILCARRNPRLYNDDIATLVNKTHSTKYNPNYISTLYYQSIIPSICATATLHLEVCRNLFFPENFKKCKDCGQYLLKSKDFFMQKSRIKDGFDCRCKTCAKAKK